MTNEILRHTLLTCSACISSISPSPLVELKDGLNEASMLIGRLYSYHASGYLLQKMKPGISQTKLRCNESSICSCKSISDRTLELAISKHLLFTSIDILRGLWIPGFLAGTAKCPSIMEQIKQELALWGKAIGWQTLYVKKAFWCRPCIVLP